jgi:hypothetical protein
MPAMYAIVPELGRFADPFGFAAKLQFLST